MITNKTFDEIAIGDEVCMSRTLTKRDVDMFAMMSGDMNPTHFSGAIIDGPLAFDNAISKEAATIKGISTPVAGEADVFLVPDLESGNLLTKQLQYLVNAEAAGIVLGARVPFVLNSRADSRKARLASSAVAVAVAHARRHGKVQGGAS